MHFRGDTEASINTEQRVGGPTGVASSPLQRRLQAGQEARRAGGQEDRAEGQEAGGRRGGGRRCCFAQCSGELSLVFVPTGNGNVCTQKLALRMEGGSDTRYNTTDLEHRALREGSQTQRPHRVIPFV